MRTIVADARLACRSDDAFAGIDQTFNGIELATNSVAVALDDDADYYSNRNDKGEDTCHEKKLDCDHLNLLPLARSTDAMSKVEKASRKDIGPKEFMTNLHVRLSKQT
jgi:hypothetical protein